MLRSKQLLPFAKGARAWLVAGSVSKPNPLDGTSNPGEDGKAEQGYSGTKGSQPAKPHILSRAEDGPFRRGITPPVGASSGTPKFERIHEDSRSTFIPGPSLAPRSVAASVTIPSKDINVILPPAAGDHHPTDSSSQANLSAVVPAQAVQNAKGLVSKSNATEHNGGFAAEKSTEVGLATVSNLSGKGPAPKHGQSPKVKALDADGSRASPVTRADRSYTAGVQTSVVSDGAAPLNHSILEKKTLESRSAAVSAASVQDTKVPSAVESTTVEVNSRKPLGSAESKEGESKSKQTILFGTIDAPVDSPKQAQNTGVEAPFIEKNPSRPPPGPRPQTAKYTRSSPKGASSEVNGVIVGSRGQDVSSKNAGASKSREVNSGVSGNRRRGNGYNQAGGTRQSHWSARDSGGEGGSNEMVDQVGSILKRMGWTSQTVDALAAFNSRLSAFHINEVLKHQREPGLAWEFFNWAKRQNGYKHDVRTYTTMIGILGRVRNFDACDRLMNDMRREGCEPSVVTFNRLIHSYGRANYLGEALNLFQHMQEVGCQPDRVTYCTLIDLHSKAGFHDIAMDICQKMWQAGFEADTFSYTLIIHCLGKAGNLPAAYQLFQEMIDKGCTPNLVTYNIMIDLHAKAGKHHMALKLYNDLQDAGYRPDNVTYSVIMEVLGHSGHMDEAENVFMEMEQAGWAADATTYGSLVYMWGQTGNVKKATEWYNRMLASGLSPNVPTCNSLLWAYMRVNEYEAAQEVLQSMPKWRLYPTLPTYTLLLSSCTTCKNQQDVDSTLLIMSRTGHPAHAFLCKLLSETDSRASTAYVQQFFDSLHEEEQENKRSFADALIEFFYKLDHKDRAGVVWEVAVEKNLYPSAICQRAPNYWIVDLHVMSIGTAVVALLRTLAGLRERMLATGDVPDRIEIVTGWGKHSRVSGFSKIKNVVENILQALHAPFYIDNSNVGCFVGSGQPLVDWLHQPDMDHMLAL
ncbi:unnamed protein product [Calypogeia fissa]